MTNILYWHWNCYRKIDPDWYTFNDIIWDPYIKGFDISNGHAIVADNFPECPWVATDYNSPPGGHKNIHVSDFGTFSVIRRPYISKHEIYFIIAEVSRNEMIALTDSLQDLRHLLDNEHLMEMRQ